MISDSLEFFHPFLSGKAVKQSPNEDIVKNYEELWMSFVHLLRISKGIQCKNFLEVLVFGGFTHCVIIAIIEL